MGWNEPDKGKDPWKGGSEPPDLEEALKQFQKKIKQMFSGKKPVITEPSSASASADGEKGSGVFLGLMAAVLFIVWFLSGIFIVDPAERAVILRLGRYIETVGPGPHWIPRFIDTKIVENVERVSDYSYAAQMLTKDENLVAVAVVVQYQIADLQAYLFNVADPEESLRQATSSALRQVVGNTRLDQIITEGREAWGISVQDTLTHILDSYKTGIKIVNVSPQPARAPEHVQDAFDDAIKAQEDEKRFKEQARAYEASVVPIAEGNAKRIIEESKAFEAQVVLKAQGETAEFLALLPEYLRAPQVMAKRLYIETMQQVFSQTSKVIIDGKTNPLLSLPLEQWFGDIQRTKSTTASVSEASVASTSSNHSEEPLSQTSSRLIAGRETQRATEPMIGRESQ